MYLNKDDFSYHSLLFIFPYRSSSRWMASGRGKSRLMVFGVGGFPGYYCSLTGCCVTDARRSLVPGSTHSARLSRLTWVSWRSIAAVFDNSRYSWETWRQEMNRGTVLFDLRCSCCCQLRLQLPWYPWSPEGPSIALPIDPLSPAPPTSPGKQEKYHRCWKSLEK